jgi:cyclopropane-fatty-acyl-phospholipid synthase
MPVSLRDSRLAGSGPLRHPTAMQAAEALAPLVHRMIGTDLPFRIRFWDGSAIGPADAPATIVVRTPRALRRVATAPGELGLGRADVSGEIDLEGDLQAVLALADRRPEFRVGPGGWARAARTVVAAGAFRPLLLPPPPEEARLRGRRHTRQRDAAAISHHYDISNDFYRLVLGPTLTYSCAYFASPESSLEDAQTDKHELICRKLSLQDGERMLDVGCGWGTLAIHAATRHGVSVVGVTLSEKQAELAEKRAAEAGVGHRVEIRVQDERDVDDGPFDAVASVGMFEHVGAERLAEYFGHLHSLLRPHGRLLNHGISRPPGRRTRFVRRGFIDRYVFPDGELHEVGAVASVMQRAGFEVRDLQSLREHYALTLRRWVANLEAGAGEAVGLVGEGRYRVWRLYMAAAARNFEMGRTQVHQILAVRSDRGRSGLPLRRSV